jgi:hypothetical protein
MTDNFSWTDVKNICLTHKKNQDERTIKQRELDRKMIKTEIIKHFSNDTLCCHIRGDIDEIIKKELTDNGFNVTVIRKCYHFKPNDKNYTGCLSDKCTDTDIYTRITLA